VSPEPLIVDRDPAKHAPAAEGPRVGAEHPL